jgi:hypothetical protein
MMTSLPRIIPDEPVGIVIRSGREIRKPAAIWAYLWAADDENAKDHWHNHVPVERAA